MHNRRTNIILLACSLLLAAGMWFIHILSQSYYAYLPFSIRAVSDVRGYAPKSSTVQTIFLGGKASGFFLLGYNLSGKQPIEIEVEIPFADDEFTVQSTAISDRISEHVNSYFEMTYVPETTLSFVFESRDYKRVPIESGVTVECQPQYMAVSEVTFEPDSVTVYGNDSDLETIEFVKTRNIVVAGLKKSTSGVVELEKDKQFRYSPGDVTYSVNVARYYEYSFTVNLSTVNVPYGKTLILLPSQVDVTCRLPLDTDFNAFKEEVRFVIDYNDVISSRSAKVSPKMEDTDCRIYACTFTPSFVEGVIMEGGR